MTGNYHCIHARVTAVTTFCCGPADESHRFMFVSTQQPMKLSRSIKGGSSPSSPQQTALPSSSQFYKHTQLSNMFFRLSTLLPIVSLASVVSALNVPAPAPNSGNDGMCSTGTRACCKQLLQVRRYSHFQPQTMTHCICLQSDNQAIIGQAKSLGATLPGTSALAGLTCTLGDVQCPLPPVCCQNVYGVSRWHA